MSLPAGIYQPIELSYRDAGNEIGRMQFYGALVADSDDTGNVEELNSALAAFITKAAAVANGALAKAVYVHEHIYTTTQPTNGAARELKLLIQYQDNTTGKGFTTTLPTLNPDIPVYVINKNVKDAVRVDTPTAITDLITAFQGLAKAPETGNDVTVVGLRVVGRNN